VSRRSDTALIATAALVVKLPFLTQEAVTFDAERTQYYSTWEGLTALVVQPTAEPHSPLYYAVTFVFRHVLGSGHLGLRAPALLSAVLVAPAVYLLGRRITTRRGAVAAGLITATVPYLTRHGQTARMYATAALLAVVATILYLRLVDSERNGDVLIYGVVAAAGVWVHAFGVLVVASHVAHAVTFERPWQDGSLRRVTGGFVVAGVGSLPVVWLVVARVASGRTAGGTPEFTIQTVWVTLQGLVKLGVWTGTYESFDTARELVALFVLVVVAGLGLRSLYDPQSELLDDRAVTIPLTVGVVSLGVLAVVSVVIEPVWAGRRLAVVAPFLYLAVGVGAGRVDRHRLTVVVVTGLVVVFAIGSFLLVAPVSRPAWDDGVTYVDAKADADDLVVSGNPHPQPEVEYYREGGGYTHVGIGFSWTNESVSSKVIGPDTVWVIGYSERADAARRVLDRSNRYRHRSSREFDGGLLVTRYERLGGSTERNGTVVPLHTGERITPDTPDLRVGP
jgi:4-amino-4-deoxy-L-arabinose transferase-like glycosyltransferase